MVDPEVRAIARSGHARVLVMLHVGNNGAEADFSKLIARAQDAVLARLPQSHPTLPRRSPQFPCSRSRSNNVALLAFEQMTNVVAAVKSDRPMKPQ